LSGSASTTSYCAGQALGAWDRHLRINDIHEEDLDTTHQLVQHFQSTMIARSAGLIIIAIAVSILSIYHADFTFLVLETIDLHKNF
jgi:hypothetical protein